MDSIKTELEKRDVLRLNNMESNRLTRECLEVALIYLMSEKPLEKITITELVKRSGVSRTAFYRNYATKEDILKGIGQELADTIGELLEKPEYRENPYQWYLECFHLVQDHLEILKLLENAHITMDMIYRSGSIVESLHPSDNYEEHYRRIATEAAFHKILSEWLQGGLKESAEDMAALCVKIFVGRNGIAIERNA